MTPTGVYPRPSLEERFWAKVDRRGPDECWEWRGASSPGGYGQIRGEDGRLLRAPRVVYEALVAPIPDGWQIDHLCRNPPCVNPAHLEAVTPSVNVRRGTSPAASRARQTHCFRGHLYDEANTYRNPRGWRSCRICRRAMDHAWFARRNAA